MYSFMWGTMRNRVRKKTFLSALDFHKNHPTPQNGTIDTSRVKHTFISQILHYNSDISNHGTRDVQFGSKMGQTDNTWYMFGTFWDQISLKFEPKLKEFFKKWLNSPENLCGCLWFSSRDFRERFGLWVEIFVPSTPGNKHKQFREVRLATNWSSFNF